MSSITQRTFRAKTNPNTKHKNLYAGHLLSGVNFINHPVRSIRDVYSSVIGQNHFKTRTMLHLQQIKSTLPPQVSLVAVSKFHPASLIAEAYREGQRIFGESRVQELQQKYEVLPKDIEWHFIGHLQVNKVKYIAPYISLIHAVDSLKLLKEIDKQAAKHQRVIRCLLEIHLAQESTKFGLTPEACIELLQEGSWKELKHVEIAGLMCMASHTDNTTQIQQEFHQAYSLFEQLKQTFFQDNESFSERSWGMSNDYPTAISEGATMVRIGSAIFGEREY